MALEGEFGKIVMIECQERPYPKTVIKGVPVEVSGIARPDKDAVVYPDNCPRGRTFDSSEPLGCLACNRAYVEYSSGRDVLGGPDAPEENDDNDFDYGYSATSPMHPGDMRPAFSAWSANRARSFNAQWGSRTSR